MKARAHQISKRRTASERAFTLIEIFVVTAILLVLLALGLGPGAQILREGTSSAGCVSNLRQIGTAFHMYAAEHNGDYPPIAGDSSADSKDAQDGKGLQWDQQLVPYLGIPVQKAKTPLRRTVYCCPASIADPSYANKPVVLLSYTYNINIGKSEDTPGVKAGNAANASSVMLLADLQLASSTPGRSYVPQTGQGRNNSIVFRPATSYYRFLADRHRDRMNILFLDGHVDPRSRVTEGDPTSPPRNVRWTPDGPLTSQP